MTTMRKEQDPVTLLTHLMELDRAAIEGYRIASEHVTNDQYRAQLLVFKEDHQRHIDELGPVLRELGGTPPAPESKIRVLPGMVEIAGREGDEAVLLAMQNNEDGTAEAYRDALEQAPEQAREIVARGLEDEERHRQWLNVTLSDLAASASYQGAAPSKRPGATPPPPIR